MSAPGSPKGDERWLAFSDGFIECYLLPGVQTPDLCFGELLGVQVKNSPMTANDNSNSGQICFTN